jgi:FixJ family two-component response regulator
MSDRSIVHIIDDDPGMRKSLDMLMESASLPARFYESAEAFLEEFDAESCGCLVLDLRMPGMGGLELLQRLRAERNEIPVIVISGHADVSAAVRSMKLGAVDLLQKPFEPKTLIAAVRGALEKHADLLQRHSEQTAVRDRFAGLTPRELDLLKLVVAGRSSKQIAADLQISVKTVANHRASLLAKTGAANGPDLARLSVIAGSTPAKQV